MEPRITITHSFCFEICKRLQPARWLFQSGMRSFIIFTACRIYVKLQFCTCSYYSVPVDSTHKYGVRRHVDVDGVPDVCFTAWRINKITLKGDLEYEHFNHAFNR